MRQLTVSLSASFSGSPVSGRPPPGRVGQHDLRLARLRRAVLPPPGAALGLLFPDRNPGSAGHKINPVRRRLRFPGRFPLETPHQTADPDRRPLDPADMRPHPGEIVQLADRLVIRAVGDRVGDDARRPRRPGLALDAENPVQRMETVAAAAAAAVDAPDLDIAETRREPLRRQPVTDHRHPAPAAARRREPRVEILQQGLQSRSAARQRAVADRTLDGVKIRGLAGEIRRRPRKQPAELRAHPLQKRIKAGFRRPAGIAGLAAADRSVFHPVPRETARVPAHDRRVPRRLFRAQTLKIPDRLRMRGFRILLLACHVDSPLLVPPAEIRPCLPAAAHPAGQP